MILHRRLHHRLELIGRRQDMEQCAGMMSVFGMNGMVWAIVLSVLLIAGLIVGGFVLLKRQYERQTSGEHRRYSVEDSLQERLARGEIDPDEYRQRLKALRGQR